MQFPIPLLLLLSMLLVTIPPLPPQCGIMMYFPAHEVSVECNGCGQRHSTVTLLDMKPLEEGEQFQKNLSEMTDLWREEDS